ncbi:MFS transporter [Streptomyces sp. NPDC047049]|uniref:MFS transporter n=1 Tax=Streptomyces sp. NPDC047049 TaxID=3156688 RepID=UPI0033FB7B08
MRIWGPLAAVCLGTFMLLLDITIVLVALPSLSKSLGSSLSQLQWVADGYALAVAAALLGAGMLADLQGRRRVYVAGLVVFASASVACALSPGMGWLIAARLVQGVGAAAMFTTTLSLISTLYSGRRLGQALGVWAAVAAGASALGPVMGGLLTEALDWRWIFYVNVPVTALALALTFRCIPRSTPDRSATRRPDVPGIVLFALAAGGFVHALTASHAHGWSSAETLVSLAAAVAAFVVFLAVQRRSTHPLLDLSLFHRPAFSAAMLTIAVTTMTGSLDGQVADPAGAAQTLSGGGAGTLLAAAPAGQRASFDRTLHAVFAGGHNTLALTAGALAVAGAACVFWLTRRPEVPEPLSEAVAGRPAETAGVVPGAE